MTERVNRRYHISNPWRDVDISNYTLSTEGALPFELELVLYQTYCSTMKMADGASEFPKGTAHDEIKAIEETLIVCHRHCRNDVTKKTRQNRKLMAEVSQLRGTLATAVEDRDDTRRQLRISEGRCKKLESQVVTLTSHASTTVSKRYEHAFYVLNNWMSDTALAYRAVQTVECFCEDARRCPNKQKYCNWIEAKRVGTIVRCGPALGVTGDELLSQLYDERHSTVMGSMYPSRNFSCILSDEQNTRPVVFCIVCQHNLPPIHGSIHVATMSHLGTPDHLSSLLDRDLVDVGIGSDMYSNWVTMAQESLVELRDEQHAYHGTRADATNAAYQAIGLVLLAMGESYQASAYRVFRSDDTDTQGAMIRGAMQHVMETYTLRPRGIYRSFKHAMDQFGGGALWNPVTMSRIFNDDPDDGFLRGT